MIVIIDDKKLDEIEAQLVSAIETVTRLQESVRAYSRWKSEAIEVLARWDKVYESLGSPGLPGESKSKAALREVENLRAVRAAAIRLATAHGILVDSVPDADLAIAIEQAAASIHAKMENREYGAQVN